MQASASELRSALRGTYYPAGRDELVAHAEDRGASDEVIADLQSLTGEEYESAAEVLDELGEESEEDEDDEEED